MSTSFPHPIRTALFGAALLALSGCGNKGPLVMPQKPVPVEAAPAAAPDATSPATTDPAGQAQPGRRPAEAGRRHQHHAHRWE
ncbi:lipoprotein [Xanthomonas translucens pv. undulosa]